MEGCKETLDYLLPKYTMVIVTNGFDEIQSCKLLSSGIHHYFKDIVTSARAGHKKPAKENSYRLNVMLFVTTINAGLMIFKTQFLQNLLIAFLFHIDSSPVVSALCN